MDLQVMRMVGCTTTSSTAALLLFLSALMMVQATADWTETTKLASAPSRVTSRFGWSVAIDNGVLAVGAPRDSTAFYVAGAALIYKQIDGEWSEEAKLLPSDGTNLGKGIAVHDGTVAVSSTHSSIIFLYGTESGSWTELAKLVPSDVGIEHAVGEFGYSLAMQGNTLVVSASAPSSPRTRDSVYIYSFLAGAWTEEAKLTAHDRTAFDSFGQVVAFSEDTVAVGAPRDDDVGEDSGSVYLFQREGGLWTHQAKLTARDGGSNDYFGHAVAVEGDTMCVGSFVSVEGTDVGVVHVYELGVDSWTEQSRLVARGSTAAGLPGFPGGISLTLRDGLLVVGAYGHTNRTGAAFLFTSVSGAWTEEAMLVASDGTSGNEFGFDVDIDDGMVVSGAWGANGENGAIYTFEWRDTSESPSQSVGPSMGPTYFSSSIPTSLPTTGRPSSLPSKLPSRTPSRETIGPSTVPTQAPSSIPTSLPPTGSPSTVPSESPSTAASQEPSDTSQPSELPSEQPSRSPSEHPSDSTSAGPSVLSSEEPSQSLHPSDSLSVTPSLPPTETASIAPSVAECPLGICDEAEVEMAWTTLTQFNIADLGGELCECVACPFDDSCDTSAPSPVTSGVAPPFLPTDPHVGGRDLSSARASPFHDQLEALNGGWYTFRDDKTMLFKVQDSGKCRDGSGRRTASRRLNPHFSGGRGTSTIHTDGAVNMRIAIEGQAAVDVAQNMTVWFNGDPLLEARGGGGSDNFRCTNTDPSLTYFQELPIYLEAGSNHSLEATFVTDSGTLGSYFQVVVVFEEIASAVPTLAPTDLHSQLPTSSPTQNDATTTAPTQEPQEDPTETPSVSSSQLPSHEASLLPSPSPTSTTTTITPSGAQSDAPTNRPTDSPSHLSTALPSHLSSAFPSPFLGGLAQDGCIEHEIPDNPDSPVDIQATGRTPRICVAVELCPDGDALCSCAALIPGSVVRTIGRGGHGPRRFGQKCECSICNDGKGIDVDCGSFSVGCHAAEYFLRKLEL